MNEPSTSEAPARATLIGLVRSAILAGELSPGQRLVEAELTASFDTTRGAIRQALLQLEGEGLVEREHNRGARVRTITLEDAIEITEARAVLEGLCAAKAASRATEDERQELIAIGERMRIAVERGDVVSYSSIAQEIHARIRQLSRQATVADLLERLRYQSVRYHFSVALLPGRPAVGLREHLEVIETICHGTSDEAEVVMRGHLLTVIEALRQLAQRPDGAPRVLPISGSGYTG